MRHPQLTELSAITTQRDYRDSIAPSFRALPKEPSVRSIASSTAIGPAVDIFAGSIGFFWPFGLTLGPQGCGGSFGHLRSVHRHVQFLPCRFSVPVDILADRGAYSSLLPPGSRPDPRPDLPQPDFVTGPYCDSHLSFRLNLSPLIMGQLVEYFVGESLNVGNTSTNRCFQICQ